MRIYGYVRMNAFIASSQLQSGSALASSVGFPPHACSSRTGTCPMIFSNPLLMSSSRFRTYWKFFLGGTPCASSPPTPQVAPSLNVDTLRCLLPLLRVVVAARATACSIFLYSSLLGEHSFCSVSRVDLNAMNRSVGKKCTSEPGVPHTTGQSGFGQPFGSTPFRWHFP